MVCSFRIRVFYRICNKSFDVDRDAQAIIHVSFSCIYFDTNSDLSLIFMIKNKDRKHNCQSSLQV